MARYTDFSVGGREFRKYHDGHPMWATADEVDAAKRAEANERQAVAKAAENLSTILSALIAKGMSRSEAINKLRRLNLTYDDMQKLARKVRQPKVVHASNEEESIIDDDKDDKPDADKQLAKLADAIRKVNPNFTREQAAVYAMEKLDVGRALLTASKQYSLDRYGEQAAGYFGKFDKMGGHTPPGPSRANDGSRDGTHSSENTRPIRTQTSAHLNEDTRADRGGVTMPVDENDDGPTKARKTAAAIKAYTDAGYSHDAAATKVLQQQRGW